MAKKPSKTSAETPSDPYAHGPLRAERIPRGGYAPKFLQDLQARQKVHPVGEDWNGDAASLPSHVNWVVYPNGDLERVGFD